MNLEHFYTPRDAEFGVALADMLRDHKVTYKEGWRFEVAFLAGGPLLRITIPTVDSLSGSQTSITHQIPIPPVEMFHNDPRYARRWLLDRIIDVEIHEAMEFFAIDGKAPFFPDHSIPYAIREKEEWRPIHTPGASYGTIPGPVFK